jgi:ribosomal-protein-alanine N-acetyltransferase
LVLRSWRKDDKAPFAALNADARVTEYLLGPFSPEQSDEQIKSFQAHFAREGFGRWALEVPGEAGFIGTVGISVIPYQQHFTPGVEVAWRLAHPYWGKGFATEAAAAALAFGFESADLEEIVALTVPGNLRSRAVMERLGMSRDPEDDFEHPLVPIGHALRPHFLYRLSKAVWTRTRL